MRQAARILKKILFELNNGSYKLPSKAAYTLNRCQSLMRQYELPPGRQEVAKVDISSFGYFGEKPTGYVLELASFIAKAFGCKVVVHREWRQRFRIVVNFVGIYPANEIAERAFNKIYYQLQKSRWNYISTLPSVVQGGKQQKENLGNEWASDWVCRLSSYVFAFDVPPEHEQMLDDWLDNNLSHHIGTGCVFDFDGSDNPEPMLNCPPDVYDPCGCKDIAPPRKGFKPVISPKAFGGTDVTINVSSVTYPDS